MHERLYRSRSDRMLFGVAGGMADWFNVDPSIVRLIWLLFLFTGVGFLIYLAAAIIIPEEPLGLPAAGSDAAAPTGAPTEPTGQPNPEGLAAPPASPSWDPNWQSRRATREPRNAGNGAMLIGIVLVVLGGWFLAQRLLPALNVGLFWPAVVIALGVVLVIGAMRGTSGTRR